MVVFVAEVRVVSGPMICGMHLFCGVHCMRCFHLVLFVPCCDHGVLHVRHAFPVVFVSFSVRSLCSGCALFASRFVCYIIACGVKFFL